MNRGVALLVLAGAFELLLLACCTREQAVTAAHSTADCMAPDLVAAAYARACGREVAPEVLARLVRCGLDAIAGAEAVVCPVDAGAAP